MRNFEDFVYICPQWEELLQSIMVKNVAESQLLTYWV